MRDAGPTRPREPAFNLPPILVWWIAALLLIHVLRSLVSEMTDLGLLFDLAFVPASWSLGLGYATPQDVISAATPAMADDPSGALRAALARFVTAEDSFRPWTCLTYSVLHGSWLHVGLNSVWLAAFGAPVARRAGTGRLIAVACASALGGAFAQWLVTPLSAQPVIGASAAVSGLMAAAATFVFRRPQAMDWREPARHVSPARRPDWSFLSNRNALIFLLAWFGINLLFGIVAVPLGVTEGAIAWQAHIGGLLVGLALFPFLDPGPREMVRSGRA